MSKEEFIAILAKHDFCRNKAIKEMKISRQTFYNWVKKYDVTLAKLTLKRRTGTLVINVAKELEILREEPNEKLVYETALQECDNNVARVAQHLGVCVATVHKKLLKHGIERERSVHPKEKPLSPKLRARIRKDWSFMDDTLDEYFPDLA